MKQRTFYIPGLGADSRLFSKLIPLLGGTCICWPSELGSDLNQLAENIVAVNGIQSGDVIIGFSFGGQLALEIKSLLPDIKAVQISSIKESTELTWSFKLLAAIVQIVPNFIIKPALVYLGPNHAASGNPLSDSDLNDLKEMAKSCDIDFFKKTALLCSRWRNTSALESLQINGSKDDIIPFTRRTSQIIFEGAGHLLTFTHPNQIANEVKKYVGQ